MSEAVQAEAEALGEFILSRLNGGSEPKDVSAAFNATSFYAVEGVPEDDYDRIAAFATALIDDPGCLEDVVAVATALEDVAFALRRDFQRQIEAAFSMDDEPRDAPLGRAQGFAASDARERIEDFSPTPEDFARDPLAPPCFRKRLN